MLSQAERAAGQVAGEQELAVCFADLVGFTRLGASSRPRCWATWPARFGRAGRHGGRAAGPAGQDDRRRGHARRPGSRTRWSTPRSRWWRRSRRPTCRRSGPGSPGVRRSPLRRPLRARRQPGQPGDGDRPPGQRAVHQGDARRRARVRLVVRRPPPPEGHRATRCRSTGAAPARRLRRTASGRQETESRSTTKMSVEFGGIVGGLPGLSVGQARGDDQLAPAAHLHPGDALDPALDHAAAGLSGGAERRLRFHEESNSCPFL